MHKNLATALLNGLCPRCRRGRLFAYPFFNLAKFQVMNPACAHCGVMLEPEPGFYQGAMYVGYAFTVAVIVIVGVVLYLLGDPSPWVYIATVSVIMVLLVPANYRYSRILYLYLFGGIRYDRTFRE